MGIRLLWCLDWNFSIYVNFFSHPSIFIFIILNERSRSEKLLNKNPGVAIFSVIGWQRAKKFFCSDFNKNLFPSQFGQADYESGLTLLIRALGGAGEQK